jgi:hypothetical protein
MVGPRGWGVGPGVEGVLGTWSVLIYTGAGDGFQMIVFTSGLRLSLFWYLFDAGLGGLLQPRTSLI